MPQDPIVRMVTWPFSNITMAFVPPFPPPNHAGASAGPLVQPLPLQDSRFTGAMASHDSASPESPESPISNSLS
ncbi:hypothetical protein J1614_004764 [Plenodomus biglobosus]|nr:hypothetical protein J1614_004764 [Plenodomus biglobosus]